MLTGRYRLVVAGAVLAAAGGCSGPSSLSGVVTLDGKPLADASVVLHPERGTVGELVVGSTGPDGRFVITPAAGRSIARGKYRLTVSKQVQTPEQEKENLPGSETMPEKYSNLRKTELSATVPVEGEIDLKLTSK